MNKFLLLITMLITQVTFANANHESVNIGVTNDAQREFRYQMGVEYCESKGSVGFDEPVFLQKRAGYLYSYPLEKAHCKLSESFTVWVFIQENIGKTICEVKKTFNKSGVVNPEIKFNVLSVQQDHCDVVIEG